MRRRRWEPFLSSLLLALLAGQAAAGISAAKRMHLAGHRANTNAHPPPPPVVADLLEREQESSSPAVVSRRPPPSAKELSQAQAARQAAGLREDETAGQGRARTESWLRTDHNRTLFFQPLAGLGNRLRALASAVLVAQEAGVGLVIVWQPEWPCPECGPGVASFVAPWEQLFARPELRLAEAFPGWDPDWGLEGSGAVRTRRSGQKAPVVAPPDNCTAHEVTGYQDFKAALAGDWETVAGKEVLCVKGSAWLTQRGEQDAWWFFRLLQPSPMVQQWVNDFQEGVDWYDSQWICMHIRRTDLRLWAHGGAQVQDMIPLQKYKDDLYRLLDMADGDWPTRIFLATDDPAAEEEIRSAFVDGMVVSYPKTAWGRETVEGAQQAMVDLWLLSTCPVLVGTYYSSYSETAHLISQPFYIQVGSELRRTAT